MSYEYGQAIGGRWTASSSGRTWDVLNPATEEVIRRVPFGDGEDCRRAIEAAESAFSLWARTTPYERGAPLKRAADIIRSRAGGLGETTVLESGKPFVQARGEWLVAADLFEWFAEEGKRAYGRWVPSRSSSKRHLVIKQPVGVVGLITAWNFPVYNVARAGAAALAAGCTIVIKPSEYTPLSAMELVNILEEAGIPEGVANLVNGDAESIGAEMLQNPSCAKIHFTGSHRVGQLLMAGASKTIKRLSLELGGNAPVLILPDADPVALAKSAVAAKFRNNGQVCVSPQRFFVHAEIEREFTQQVVDSVSHLKLGEGSHRATEVGPLINSRQRDRVEGLVENARESGATVAVGGQRPAGFSRGYFYEPTVIADANPQLALMKEEIFGPVLPVARFEDVEWAIQQANSTRFGLSAYVWTQNLTTAMKIAERLEFGMVGVNEWTPHGTEVPFSGWKESGLGRESGAEGLEEYLEPKLITLGGF